MPPCLALKCRGHLRHDRKKSHELIESLKFYRWHNGGIAAPLGVPVHLDAVRVIGSRVRLALYAWHYALEACRCSEFLLR